MMKGISTYITEKLRISSKIEPPKYIASPLSAKELKQIMSDEFVKQGREGADLNNIDVRKVTNMSGLFSLSTMHSVDIGEWDVSNVYDMS